MAEPSLHDTVSAAFDQVSGATPELPTPATPPPAAFPPDAKPSLGELGDKGSSADVDAGAPAGSPSEPPQGRVRGPDGRFLPKEGQQQTPAQGAESPPAASGVTPTAGGEFAEAPQSWPPEKRGEWGKVPPEVRGYLHQREGELQRGFQNIAQRANVSDAVLAEFAPYAETLAAEGATPASAIRTLLQTVNALRTGGPEYRKAVMISLAQQYGVDLTNPQFDPNLARAEAQAATLLTERMYGQTAVQQREQQQIQNEMMAFANDPKNEFFPYVRQIMGDLVGRGAAGDLQTAYDMAVKLHPEVSKEIFNRAVAARDAAARKAAVANMSVGGAPNGAAAPQAPGQMSLRDTLAAQMSNLTP